MLPSDCRSSSQFFSDTCNKLATCGVDGIFIWELTPDVRYAFLFIYASPTLVVFLACSSTHQESRSSRPPQAASNSIKDEVLLKFEVTGCQVRMPPSAGRSTQHEATAKLTSNILRLQMTRIWWHPTNDTVVAALTDTGNVFVLHFPPAAPGEVRFCHATPPLRATDAQERRAAAARLWRKRSEPARCSVLSLQRSTLSRSAGTQGVRRRRAGLSRVRLRRAESAVVRLRAERALPSPAPAVPDFTSCHFLTLPA